MNHAAKDSSDELHACVAVLSQNIVLQKNQESLLRSYPFNTEKLYWTLAFIVLDCTKAVCRDERVNT